MCTEDWRGKEPENLVTIYIGARATPKFLCLGLPCRLFFGTLTEAWCSPESPPPPVNSFNQNWLWHSCNCEVYKVWEIFFSSHMAFFDEIQFLQALASFGWFPSSQKDNSLPGSKHYSPPTEVYPWNQKPFCSQGHGQNHTSGPHWAICHIYRWMLGKASRWPCSWFISCSSQSSLWKAAPWWRQWTDHCYMSCHSSSWPAPPDANGAQGTLGLGRTKRRCPLSLQYRCQKGCWGLGWHRTCCQWH